MKQAPVLVLLVASFVQAGCATHAKLHDVSAERSPAGDIVICFSSDVDVLSAAQFLSAHLLVPSQIDSTLGRGAVSWARSVGHARAQNDAMKRIEREPADGRPEYAFRVTFPVKGEYVYSTSYSDTSVRFPYDLSGAGPYDLEFWVNGGMCGLPMSTLCSDRVAVRLQAP